MSRRHLFKFLQKNIEETFHCTSWVLIAMCIRFKSSDKLYCVTFMQALSVYFHNTYPFVAIFIGKECKAGGGTVACSRLFILFWDEDGWGGAEAGGTES